MPPLTDLTGRKMGTMQAVWPVGRKGPRFRVIWLCACECGRMKLMEAEQFTRGNTRRCGCRNVGGHTKHGESMTALRRESAEYRIWKAMKARCHDQKHISFKNYGGRGISVCERWLNSFEHFLADMGRRPSAEHSIDRFPDNDGGYEPKNCRWATPIEQAANKRSRCR